MPLLVAFAFLATAAAPRTSEQEYREAQAVVDRGDWKAAETAVDAALRRVGSPKDSWGWSLLMLRGTVLNGTGRSVEAIQLLRPALPPAMRETPAEVQRLVQLATATRGSDLQSTKQLLGQALRLAERKQHALVPYVLIYVAAFGDPADSEAILRRVLRLTKTSRDSVSHARALSDLARICLLGQRFTEGIRLAERALAEARAHGLTGLIQKTEGNLAWGYREVGDIDTAFELFLDAETLAAKVGSERDRISWRNQLANIQFDRREFAAAHSGYLAIYDRAKATNHGDAGAIAANLATASLELGNLDDAQRYNEEAQELKRKRNDSDALLHSRILEARIAAAEKKNDEAEKTLHEVAAKSTVAATRWEAEGRLAALYADLGRGEAAEQQFRRAIATARTARAALENRELRLSFYRVIDEIFGDYIDFLVRSRRDTDALATTELIRAQSLEEGLDVAPGAQQLDARALAKQQDATILCYWLGAERSYAWIITPDDVRFEQLPAKSVIEPLVDRYRRDLLSARGTLAATGAQGEELYRLLVAPAARDIRGGARVIVIPDGRLSALNFETLVVGKPRRHYWIEDVVISNGSSLQLLAQRRDKPASAPSMLLIGNALPADPAYPPLRNAKREIDAISRQFAPAKRHVLEGGAATPSAYFAASPQSFDFIHFVAHAEAARQKPLDASVILGRDSGGYKLEARRILARELHARLVTISSCNSAGTKTYVGEGLVGLAWAFRRAGSEQVIAALWEVVDAATPQLMEQMYAGIRAGKEPAAALRDAKLKLLASQGAFRRAVYWAPFVIYS